MKKEILIFIALCILLIQNSFAYFDAINNQTKEKIYLTIYIEYVYVNNPTNNLNKVFNLVIPKETFIELTVLIEQERSRQLRYKKFTNQNLEDEGFIRIEDLDPEVNILNTGEITNIQAYTLRIGEKAMQKVKLKKFESILIIE